MHYWPIYSELPQTLRFPCSSLSFRTGNLNRPNLCRFDSELVLEVVDLLRCLPLGAIIISMQRYPVKPHQPGPDDFPSEHAILNRLVHVKEISLGSTSCTGTTTTRFHLWRWQC